MTKLRSTIRILWCLLMARTFGDYQYSEDGPNSAPYAIYEWRGEYWAVPTGPVT